MLIRSTRLLSARVARPAALLARPTLAPVLSRPTLAPVHRPFFGFVQSALSQLIGGAGKDDDQLKKVFDEITGGADSISTSDFASKMAKAHGFDADKVIESAHGVGVDPLSMAVKLQMLWAVSSMDTDGDSLISYAEFAHAVKEAEAEALEAAFFSEEALKLLGIESFDDAALKAAFDKADTDGSGELDSAELKAVFLEANGALADSAAFADMLSRVLAKLDTDGSRSVSWDEFKASFLVYQLSVLERAALR